MACYNEDLLKQIMVFFLGDLLRHTCNFHLVTSKMTLLGGSEHFFHFSIGNFIIQLIKDCYILVDQYSYYPDFLKGLGYIMLYPSYWLQPNWRIPSFFRGVGQPPSSIVPPWKIAADPMFSHRKNGSRLGLISPGSDIDVLCVALGHPDRQDELGGLVIVTSRYSQWRNNEIGNYDSLQRDWELL